MDALLDTLNSECCKYGVTTNGLPANFTKFLWTKEAVLESRSYCFKTDTTDAMLCYRCKDKLLYSADNIRILHRHEEMLKALSIIAVKQEKQLEQISKLASFMEQLVVHIKSQDKPTST